MVVGRLEVQKLRVAYVLCHELLFFCNFSRDLLALSIVYTFLVMFLKCFAVFNRPYQSVCSALGSEQEAIIMKNRCEEVALSHLYLSHICSAVNICNKRLSFYWRRCILIVLLGREISDAKYFYLSERGHSSNHLAVPYAFSFFIQE